MSEQRQFVCFDVGPELEFVRVAIVLETKNILAGDLKIDNGDWRLEFKEEHLERDLGVQETGNRKQETGNRKQETGNRKQETGNTFGEAVGTQAFVLALINKLRVPCIPQLLNSDSSILFSEFLPFRPDFASKLSQLPIDPNPCQ
jgi:hypothetical protein